MSKIKEIKRRSKTQDGVSKAVERVTRRRAWKAAGYDTGLLHLATTKTFLAAYGVLAGFNTEAPKGTDEWVRRFGVLRNAMAQAVTDRAELLALKRAHVTNNTSDCDEAAMLALLAQDRLKGIRGAG